MSVHAEAKFCSSFMSGTLEASDMLTADRRMAARPSFRGRTSVSPVLPRSRGCSTADPGRVVRRIPGQAMIARSRSVELARGANGWPAQLLARLLACLLARPVSQFAPMNAAAVRRPPAAIATTIGDLGDQAGVLPRKVGAPDAGHGESGRSEQDGARDGAGENSGFPCDSRVFPGAAGAPAGFRPMARQGAARANLSIGRRMRWRRR